MNQHCQPSPAFFFFFWVCQVSSMAEVARGMEGNDKLRRFPQGGRMVDKVVLVGGATRMPCVQVSQSALLRAARPPVSVQFEVRSPARPVCAALLLFSCGCLSPPPPPQPRTPPFGAIPPLIGFV